MPGRAWKFGDGISTDHIAPGRYFHLRSNMPELAKHVLEDADPEFASKMSPGDFVVGGANFGLPVLICDTDKISAGDDLEVDLLAGTIRDLTNGVKMNFKPLPASM